MRVFDFIFMLTQHDQTVEEAALYADKALALGVKHIGFKDIGVPLYALAELTKHIQKQGGTVYLEVVSPDRDRELKSIQVGLELGVDVLLGGTHPDDVIPLLKGHDIRYCPFLGRVSGHPSILEGTAEDIAAHAACLDRYPHISGFDLLAYRAQGDVPAIIRRVCEATSKPIIVAGSIHSPEQIQCVYEAGAAGFTIGTAAIEGIFPASGETLEDQLQAIRAIVKQIHR